MDHITITDNGQKLLTRIAAGETTAVFTRIGTTDDQYTDDELQHLSALKNICQQADIVNVDVKDDTTIVISGYVDNQELEKGYYVTAVGIFAKAQGEDEILYGVSRVSNRPFLPEYTETLTGISIRLTLKVGNSSNITVNVDETTSLTTGEFYAYRRDFDEALLRIEFPQFEDYSSEETELPALEDAVGQIVSGKRITVLFRYIKASLKGLTSLAQRALSVAMGKNQARVFATVEALDAWLSVPENVDQLNVGDNFYITAMDVPDYWWDGTQKQKLETQKVDLTTYDQRISANANAISELNGNISAHKSPGSGDHDGRYYHKIEIDSMLGSKANASHNHDSHYYTENEVNNLLSGKSDTSHSHAWSAITGKPNTFTPSDHNHDGRYYTETEVNNLLAGKSAASHNHDERYFTESEVKNLLWYNIEVKEYWHENISMGTDPVTREFSIKRDGYWIAGIVATSIENATGGGYNSSHCHLYGIWYSQDTAWIRFRSTIEGKIRLGIKVLYWKDQR